jgi:uncharacterized SAM-binding protein YcdF (DUF218 family)
MAGRGVIVVTSDYHLDRARFVFAREFAGTDVTLAFIGVATDEARCELDLPALKKHEREALQRLKDVSTRCTSGGMPSP